MVERKTEAEDIQFPLNINLLEEAARIREERITIRERLKKIEHGKGRVTETVYQKVKADYTEQLTANTEKLLEKKHDIDRELATLHEARGKVAANVKRHREKLEEIKFRKNLGEYDDAAFNKAAREENEKLGKFEKILAAIESNIKQYESLFEGEEEPGFGEEPEEVSSVSTPTPMEEAPPENEEESYHVGKGEDYFGAVTEDISLSGQEARQEPKAPPRGKVRAHLVLMKGGHKGKEYELADDEVTIGRASSNTVVLKEAKVSRQHAVIKKQGTEYLIEDLHSSNGVLINDERVKEHALTDGDVIRIGDFVLKFLC